MKGHSDVINTGIIHNVIIYLKKYMVTFRSMTFKVKPININIWDLLLM